jgi:uncharacterized repeat protein (TIGR04076 family)
MEPETIKIGKENFDELYKCRITVLKKSFNRELYEKYPYGLGEPCGRLEEGQIFISENRWDPPAGLCVWAWSDLRPIIQSIHSGRRNPAVACCTDGLRPVTFLLEIIDK